jgi:hypothetical protein
LNEAEMFVHELKEKKKRKEKQTNKPHLRSESQSISELKKTII